MTVSPTIVDLARLRHNRDRAAPRFSAHRFLLDQVDAQLLDRLSDTTRQFAHVANVGANDGALSRALLAQEGVQSCTSLDVSPALLAMAPAPSVLMEGEVLPLVPQSMDLVVSSLALQFMNGLPLMLAQIKHALKPDGLFLGALIGGESLMDVRACLMEAELAQTGGAAPRVMPMVDLRTLGGLMQQAGFALPVIDRDFITVSYPNLLALLRDLRGMGANSPLADKAPPLSRAVLAYAAALYQARCPAPDGRVVATFEVLHVSGWAPHESQPQPLKPGSATASLAEALQQIKD